MSTTKTWPGGGTAVTPTSYSIPAAGELNWATLSDFLNALGDGAQSTTFQKDAVRKAVATPVTVSATTDCIVVTDLTVAGAVAVNLPAGANKQVFYVVDGKGDASTNNITITPNGAETIAGSATLVLTGNREAVQLVYNSSDTDWKIVSRSTGANPLTNPLMVPLLVVSGTVGAPSVAFSADADGTGTGFYRVGANSMGFAANGVNVGQYSSTGAWTVGVSGGSQAHTAIGTLTLSNGSGVGAFTTNSSASGNKSSHIFQKGASNFGEIGVAGAGGDIITGSSAGDLAITTTGSTNIRFSTGAGTIAGTLDTNAAWTFGVSGGSQTHVLNGNAVRFNGASPRFQARDASTGSPGYEFYTGGTTGRAVIMYNDTSDALEFYNLTTSSGTPIFSVPDGGVTNFGGGFKIANSTTLSTYTVSSTSTTFTFNGTGGGTTGSTTVRYYRIGDWVTVHFVGAIQAATGLTSNSTTFTANTALDAFARPATTSQNMIIPGMTIGNVVVAQPGALQINTSGTLTIFRDITGATYTNNSTNGTAVAFSVTYYVGTGS